MLRKGGCLIRYFPGSRLPQADARFSDGLLPGDTEMGMPGCNETNKYQALHVNHEELKNHQSVTILLDQIFNGQKYDTRDPYFFKINPK